MIKINFNHLSLATPSTPQIPQAPQFNFNKTPTNSNYCNNSPRKFQLTNINKSPVVNTSITKPKLSPFNVIKMNKENQVTDSASPNKRKSDHSTSVVRNIKAKFETAQTETNNVVQMTPRSIIKKFEALSRDGVAPLNGSIMQPSSSSSSIQQTAPLKISTSKTNLPATPLPFQVNLKKTIPDSHKKVNDPNVSEINNEHINPKSIIERFEQLTKINSNNVVLTKIQPEFLPQNGVLLAQTTNSVELTYISSLASSNRQSIDNKEDQNDVNSTKDEAIYEELGIKDTNETKDTMNTSLFEESMQQDDEEENTATTSDVNTQETYSISSSYTGSIINQEFEDIIDLGVICTMLFVSV